MDEKMFKIELPQSEMEIFFSTASEMVAGRAYDLVIDKLDKKLRKEGLWKNNG